MKVKQYDQMLLTMLNNWRFQKVPDTSKLMLQHKHVKEDSLVL